MSPDRTLPWDWYSGRIPDCAQVDPTAYIETAYSFRECRATEPGAIRMARGSSVYQGVMFDVGPRGRVTLGEYALVNGGRLICDASIEVGHHALISWNVVIMDSYRLSMDPLVRRRQLEAVAQTEERFLPEGADAQPVRIGPNVWIGFDACVLPGVSIGEAAVVGARSVVVEDVPAYSVVAGNPARLIRRIEAAGVGQAGDGDGGCSGDER